MLITELLLSGNHRVIKIMLLLIVLTLTWSCKNSVTQDDREKLLLLQQQQQTAHLQKDAELLTSMLADTFISIDSGHIDTLLNAEAARRFQSHFNRVEFIAWDNIQEPSIQISNDGSMAYIIVHKYVHLIQKRADGDTLESKTTFAWLEAWEKQGKTWRMKTIASTDHPGMPHFP